MKKPRHATPVQEEKKRRVSLSRIALWQFITFFAMLLLIWVNEVLDLSSIFYGEASSDVDIFGASILTAFVIVVAIITVGNTYIQGKRMLSGLITICSRCHRIRIEKDAWDELEEYLTNRSGALFSHGLCPICYREEVKKIESMPPPDMPPEDAPHTAHEDGDDWEVFTPPKEIAPRIKPPPKPEDEG